MPQAGIITIRLEAFFVYGIGDTNRIHYKGLFYSFVAIDSKVTQFFFDAQ